METIKTFAKKTICKKKPNIKFAKKGRMTETPELRPGSGWKRLFFARSNRDHRAVPVGHLFTPTARNEIAHWDGSI